MKTILAPLVVRTMAAAVCFCGAAHSQVTVFHYRVNDTDAAGLPNVPSVGGSDGTAQGTFSGLLSDDIPTVGVPAGAGNRSLVGANDANSDGVNSAATQELLNATVIANGGFTFECWFKWFGGGDVNPLIDYAGTEKIRLTGGNLDMQMDSGSGPQVLQQAPTANEWHYLAVVFEHDGNAEVNGQINGTMTWYYDSAEVAGSASAIKDDFGDSLVRVIGVGRHPQGFDRDNFDGLIYEPRVTLGALSSSQLLFTVAPDVPLQLDITSSGSDLTFSWDSQAGKVYDLLTSVDPEGDGDPDTWAPVAGKEGIAATPDTNTETITRPADPTRLYVVRERNAPPPPPVFFDDFETDKGWTTGANGGDTGTTVWLRGAPAADGFGPDTGFDGSTNCFGTNLTSFYGTNTDIYLRSPEIDLSGFTSATLSMVHFLDNDSFDPAAIRVLKSSDLSPLGDVVTNLWNPKFDTLWDQFAPMALPAGALGEKVLLEFQFTSDGTTEFDGWYIDNVQVDAQ